MVFTELSRVLLGIVLLSYIRNVVNEEVDIKTLARVKKVFDIYTKGQYAVAINIQKEYCQKDSKPLNNDFLAKELEFVNKIGRDSKNVYIGNELIAAGFHVDTHSEYLLMDPPKESPLTDLLKKKEDGYVVFYTLNSPCIDQCLNNIAILAGLKELQNYKGIKAFVYTNIYKTDKKNKNLQNELKKIARHVPLYRCSKASCISCGKSVIKSGCLS